jgi:hypothetical protein
MNTIKGCEEALLKIVMTLPSRVLKKFRFSATLINNKAFLYDIIN